MTMAPGNEQSRRLLAVLVAYAVVLALLGGAGFAYWLDRRGGLSGMSSVGPKVTRGVEVAWEPATLHALQAPMHGDDQAISSAGKAEPLPAGPDLPPRPVESQEAAPARTEAAQVPAMPSPPAAGASDKEPAVPSVKVPEPPAAICKSDVRPWPVDRTNQVKVIQILLRDLGFYSGTTYGTFGPATRAAIGRFQLAVNELETGEPTEMLFEALKKKCASPAP